MLRRNMFVKSVVSNLEIPKDMKCTPRHVKNSFIALAVVLLKRGNHYWSMLHRSNMLCLKKLELTC